MKTPIALKKGPIANWKSENRMSLKSFEKTGLKITPTNTNATVRKIIVNVFRFFI